MRRFKEQSSLHREPLKKAQRNKDPLQMQIWHGHYYQNDNPDALESIYMWSPNPQNLLRKSTPFAASCQYESEEERKCNLCSPLEA